MVLRISHIVVIVSIYVLLPATPCRAQERSAIKVIARAHPDSIVLRWAPSSSSAWKLLNKYGYRIERYTISRDGKSLDQKPATAIASAIMPAEQSRWQSVIERDDFVAISAQAIFGEEFQIDPGSSSVMDIYNKSKELDSRYSFALFAADLSSLAANLSGLRFVDKNVNASEMYLYRVYSLVPENLKVIEFGFIYTGPAEYQPLPVPRPPEVENKSETSVLIRWETSALRDFYIGYYLERSIDKATFTRVNDLPMSVLSSKATEDGISYSSKSDTLIVGQRVVYRIRGVNSFGESGPPSEILEFLGKHPFDYVPAISKATVINNFHVKVIWKNENSVPPNLSGYDLERSDKTDGIYRKVNDAMIEKTQLEFTDQRPLSSNYYRLVAISDEGQRNNSFPNMVQLEDSIPPLPPTGLKVLIDSIGKVSMSWKKSNEADLLGYKVFRSRFKNSEFSQVTISPVELESFIDTVNIKTLSSRMYYKLAAVDNRFNTSGFSELVELELPDVIPPVPPVITQIRPQKDGIEIRWIKSSSIDVKEHRIYRSSTDSVKWRLIRTIRLADTVSRYLDRPYSANKFYRYVVAAVDRNGLQSPMMKAVTAKLLPDTGRNGIETIKAKVDREGKSVEVSWKDKKEAVQKYLIYRSKDDEPLTLYSSVSSDASNFTDKNLSMGSAYSYRVRTLYRDGTESFFSEVIKINY